MVSWPLGDAKKALFNLFGITRITTALMHFGSPLVLALPQQALGSPYPTTPTPRNTHFIRPSSTSAAAYRLAFVIHLQKHPDRGVVRSQPPSPTKLSSSCPNARTRAHASRVRPRVLLNLADFLCTTGAVGSFFTWEGGNRAQELVRFRQVDDSLTPSELRGIGLTTFLY